MSITALASRSLTGICAAVALLTLGQPSQLSAQLSTRYPTVADSIRGMEAARSDALLKADTAALSRMVADDFVEVSRLGTLRTKADNIRDIASGDLQLHAVKYDSQTVRVYSDVAILVGIADNTGTYRGTPFTGRIRYTRVFVRRGGQWKAVLMQQTPLQ